MILYQCCQLTNALEKLFSICQPIVKLRQRIPKFSFSKQYNLDMVSLFWYIVYNLWHGPSIITTISYSYMILGPCHKLYTIYQNKDTVSNLYCFENDKREPVDYNLIFLYDSRTMSQYIQYIKIKTPCLNYIALKMINTTLSTTISYSYMILGPCHKLYTIYQNKDTVSKLYCFENDKHSNII
jgi:hypothetical protein